MVSLEEAIAEAYASAPDSEIVFDALEIDHPSFTTPARVVNWPLLGPEPEKFLFKHEVEAELNPNQIVEYLGVPFELLEPESSTNSAGIFQIKISLHAEFDKYLEAAATSLGVIRATYRQYIKGRETEGPAISWYGLTITSPRREGATIIADASVLAWANEPYGQFYLPSDYPALVSGR